MRHNTDRAVSLTTTLAVALLVGLTACVAARTPVHSPTGNATPQAERTAQEASQIPAQAPAQPAGRVVRPPTPAPPTQSTVQPVARPPGKTVWDGIYTVEQAAKGRDVYRRICSECHSTGEAPAIVGTSFIRRWFDDGLDIPLTKMRRTMPDDAPGTLPEESYLDVLSYMLEAAGLPAGAEPLTADLDRLAAIKVVEQAGSAGAVPNFSLVQVVGCLVQSADGVWALTNSTSPARTREPGNSPAATLEELQELPLGSQRFLLQTVQSQHLVLKDHKVQVKGILIRNPAGDRLNPTTVQSLSERCTL